MNSMFRRFFPPVSRRSRVHGSARCGVFVVPFLCVIAGCQTNPPSTSIAGTSIGGASIASADGPARAHPLAEDQLDGITAAGLTLVPRASAIAFGANAVASESIEARTAEGQVLKVRWAKPVRGIEWAADVETFNGVIGLAHAGASASGSGGADCNAQIQVQADYVQSLNSKTTTGTIAICNCTALGIALLK